MKKLPTLKAFTSGYDVLSSILVNQVTVFQSFSQQGKEIRPPGIKFMGLWDTGATRCMINQTVVEQCGLTQIGMTEVAHAHGKTKTETYLINLLLPNEVEFQNVLVSRGDVSGVDMLIGMDIILTGDFSVTSFAGKTTFSFRMPSQKRIDYAEEINSMNRKVMGRNAFCFCGSGLKFKKCHGK